MLLFITLIIVFSGTELFGQCYELVWSEEFEVSGLPDESTWTYDIGGSGWGNNELQYYTQADPDNVQIENGRLVITARKESLGGREFTSARLKTQGLKSFRYGRIEARMKLPFGQGIWPAFWMLGDSISSMGWPACGEIDIMEMVGGSGREQTTHGTIHYENHGHQMNGGHTSLPSGRLADAFHLYSIEWDPDQITWYFDGTPFHQASISGSALNEFQESFFLILNLAVGGNWPGSPDETTQFPQHFEIDFIRVYQTDTQPEIKGPDKPSSHQELNFRLPDEPTASFLWKVPDGVHILSGQGSHSLIASWGCFDGIVACDITTACRSYETQFAVRLDHSISAPGFAEPNQESLSLELPSMHETTYYWTVPEGVQITTGQATNRIQVNWNDTDGTVIGAWNNSCGEFQSSHIIRMPGQYPYPNPNQPAILPGTIQPAYFDFGGEGVAYHDTSTQNEGNGIRPDEAVDTEFQEEGGNVGWILSGEWLEYTVDIRETDSYHLQVKVATDLSSGGPFRLLFNDEEIRGDIMIANTGGWGSFTTLNLGDVFLPAGRGVLRFETAGGGFNLGPLTISAKSHNDILPHLTPEEALFESDIVFLNTSGLPTSIQLVPFLMDGEKLDPFDIFLDSHETKNFSPYEAFIGNSISHLKFNGDGLVQATTRYVRKGHAQMPAHATVSSTAAQHFLLFPAEWSLVWDGCAIVNAGETPCSVQFRQVRFDGTVVSTSSPSASIQPAAKSLYVFNNLFAEVPNSIIELHTDQPCHILALRGTHEESPTSALFQVQPTEIKQGISSSQEFWIPHITPLAALFSTKILIGNPTDQVISQSFEAFNPDGHSLGSISAQIPTGVILSLNELPQDTSHVRFSLESNIFINLVYSRKQSPSVSAHVQPAEARREWIIVPGDPSTSWDGLAVINTSEQVNTVFLEQVDYNGRVLSEVDLGSLNAHAKRLFLPEDFFPFRDFSFYRLSASQPISILALRGTPNHQELGILFETKPPFMGIN